VTCLILVLGDQLSDGLAALGAGHPTRAEVAHETAYISHRPQKVVPVLSAMHHFGARLTATGWRVPCTPFDDP